MIKSQALIQGVQRYIDQELAPLSSGSNAFQQLIFGFEIGVVKRKSDTILRKYLKNPMLKTFDLIDDDDNVDIDTLYQSLYDAMNSQGNIELLGIKFTTADLNKLYSMLKEGSPCIK